MKSINSIYFLVCFALLFFGCADEGSGDSDSEEIDEINPISKANAQGSTNTNKDNAILIFRLEKKLEIWENGSNQKTVSIDIDPNTPIGMFNAKKSEAGIRLNFPNQFYKEKNYQVKFESEIQLDLADFDVSAIKETPIYIFPNDARNGRPFVAQFSSPHWMAALYAKMNLYLLEFN